MQGFWSSFLLTFNVAKTKRIPFRVKGRCAILAGPESEKTCEMGLDFVGKTKYSRTKLETKTNCLKSTAHEILIVLLLPSLLTSLLFTSLLLTVLY